MSCEPSFIAYQEAHAALAGRLKSLAGFEETLGGKLGTQPMLLVGGELASWRRYAQETEIAATNLRAALDAYIAAAGDHA